MQIVVASGKGGTGKTTLATSLALCGAKENKIHYLDCDVEEPNGHIFLAPKLDEPETVYLTIPELDENNCTSCGKCAEICRFNAIQQFGETVMIFPELCHSCMGCFLVCEDNGLAKKKREIGVMEQGKSGSLLFSHGRLRVGEAMSIPLLKAVKHSAEPNSLLILDSPPGTSCPFVESVIDADFVILVTEPTPFGLHDLGLASQVLDDIGKKYGVIINRSDIGDDRVQNWCKKKGIAILLEIPFSRRIAEGYAHGRPLVESLPELRKSLTKLLEDIIND